MSDERKVENEIIKYSVYRGKQAYASEMRGKQRNYHVWQQTMKVGTGEETLSIPLMLHNDHWRKIISYTFESKNYPLMAFLPPVCK